MTREELEQLSEETFFDNNKGEIQPAGHRNFNNQLIGFVEACLEASKRYTVEKVAELVDGSPEQLDTLKEFAEALGNDPNFAATIMQLIGQKLDTANYTAADVLAKLLTVHGKGSGLVADMTADHFTGNAKRTYYLNESQYAALTTAVKNDTNNVFYIIKN